MTNYFLKFSEEELMSLHILLENKISELEERLKISDKREPVVRNLLRKLKRIHCEIKDLPF